VTSAADTPRPVRQEAQRATDEIVELAPGVLRTQLPIDLPGLGHVNMYVLEDDRGVAVVDPGMPGRESFNVLKARLKEIGVPLKRVHSVLVTHSHPDHYGGAGRLRKEVGAEIIAHRRFRLWWDPKEPPDVDVEDMPLVRPTIRPNGSTPWGGQGYDIPWSRRTQLRMHAKLPRVFGVPHPSRRVDEGDRIFLARREWLAIHTPGHTEDHLCLLDPESGLLISGDHVLPTITPHISGMTHAPDPLKEFFGSLDKIGSLGSQMKLALPAHGSPFNNVAERVEHIKEHHVERLEKLRQIGAEFDRPATVMDIAKHLFSARAQGPMADSETYAHLEHLRLAGEFDCRERDGLLEYVRVN
jgi:glyoxylase-like metal-dependent hydrolase (beta-lactamase superfamily II)